MGLSVGLKSIEVGPDVLYTGGVSLMGVLGPWLFGQPGGLRALEDESLAAAASGRLEPLVGPPFALSEAAAAHVALESRATVGKTVLVPDGSPLLVADSQEAVAEWLMDRNLGIVALH